MKKKKIAIEIVLWLLVVCLSQTVRAVPMSTSFTFQGQITDDGKPANGEYDLNVRLFDDPNTGSQIGTTIHFEDIRVEQGSLTVELDFVSDDPNAFNGDARWLEISLRRGNSTDPGDYVTLFPRIEITPVPYALYAVKADAISGGTPNYIPKFLHGNKLGNSVIYESAGYIGLGTTSPARQLHVYEENGNSVIEIESGNNNAGVTIKANADGTANASDQDAAISFCSEGTLKAEIRYDNDAGALELNTMPRDSNRFVIDPDGNIGIGIQSPSEKLHVHGKIKMVDGSEGLGKVLTSDAAGVASWQDPSAFGLPQGVIVMWYGSIADIPNGWALCDGTQGTPDLRNRFVVGAGNSYNPGNQGGSASHAHNAGSLTASSHTHPFSGTTNGPSGTKPTDTPPYADNSVTNDHTHTYSGTTNAGGGGAISGTSDSANSLPPYYALAYIMKI